MKHLLLTTIATVLLMGCGESQPTAKAPDISIWEAAATGNIEAVKQHLAAGTDVNAKDKKGRTPLHYAATHGHKKIVELLIAKGADVNALNNKSDTPLNLAVPDSPFDSTEIANLLRKHGAKTGEELKAEGK